VAYSPIAGTNVTIYVPSTPATLTNGACTRVGSTNKYKLNSTSARVLDPATAVVVKDGGVEVATTGYTINYLEGSVTFTVLPSGAVTISGKTIPLYALIVGKSASIRIANSTTDKTVFGDAARAAMRLFPSVSGSIDTIAYPGSNIDNYPSDPAITIEGLSGISGVVLEFRFSSTVAFRAFVMFSQRSVSAAETDMMKSTWNYDGVLVDPAGAVGEVRSGNETLWSFVDPS
jgi:hypothetical protein